MRFGQFISFLSILAIGGKLPLVWGKFLTDACKDEGGYVAEIFDIIQQQIWDEAANRTEQLRTFYLCPDANYVLDTGNFDWFYIYLPNTHILCGKNGKRSNNCIVESKDANSNQQVLLFPGFDENFNVGGGVSRRLDNVVFRGVTFKGHGAISTGAPVYIRTAGHVVFEDCLWDTNWGLYLMIGEVEFPPDDKEEDDSLKVEVVDSTIEKGESNWGIFSFFGANLSVVNTDVKDYDIVSNIPPTASPTAFSSVFDQFGGELEIIDSCFTNIKVTHGIVVSLARTLKDDDGNVTGKEYTNGTFVNIYAEGNDIRDPSPADKACEDIRIATPDKPNFTNAECIAFDGVVCPTDAPTTSPTQAPSNIPTESFAPTVSMAPSDVPSSAPSGAPTVSMAPSDAPTSVPSDAPSSAPSSAPTTSMAPSDAPSRPTPAPVPTSAAPTSVPTKVKTCLASVVAFSIAFGLGLIS